MHFNIFHFGFLLEQVWPIEVDLKFLEPIGRELKQLGKVKSFLYLSYIQG